MKDELTQPIVRVYLSIYWSRETKRYVTVDSQHPSNLRIDKAKFEFIKKVELIIPI